MRSVSSNDLPEVSSDIANPKSGNLWHNTTDKVIRFFNGTVTKTLAFLEDIAQGVPNKVYTSESVTVSTSTITSYLEKTRLTTPVITSGKYRLGWYYNWNYNSTANNFLSQLKLIGEGSGGSDLILMTHVQEPQDSEGTFGSTGTNQQYHQSGFIYLTFSTDASHEITLEWSTSRSGVQASIWNARLELWKVIE